MSDNEESARGNSRERSDDESPRNVLERLLEAKLEKTLEGMLRKTHKRRKAAPPGESDDDSEERPSRVRKLAVTSDVIPTFDPEDRQNNVSAWINKIEQMGKIHGWSEYEKSCFMQTRLRGDAREWFNKLPEYDLSWSEWKEALMDSFPRHQNYAAVMVTLVNRQKTRSETMTQYFRSKLSLIRQCRLDDAAAISLLIHGLPQELQANGYAYRCETPSQLYSGFLSPLDDYRSPTDSSHGFRGSALPVMRQQNSATTSGTQRHTNQGAMRCRECKVLGHLARDCPRRRRECFHCKKTGHVRADCWLLDPSKKPTARVGAKHSRTETNIRLIDKLRNTYMRPALIDGNAVTSYLDTGSEVNVISDSIVKKLNLATRYRKHALCGFGGARIICNWSVDFLLKIDQIEVYTTATVASCDMHKIDLIVGQPIINRTGVALVVEGQAAKLVDSGGIADSLRLLALSEEVVRHKIVLEEAYDIPPATTVPVVVRILGARDEEDIQFPGSTFAMGLSTLHVPGGIVRAPLTKVFLSNVGNEGLRLEKGRLLARGDEVTNHPVDVELGVSTRIFAVNVFKDIDVGEISEADKCDLVTLLNKWANCFNCVSDDVGTVNLAELKIKLKSDKPICFRPYRLSAKEREVVREKIGKLLDAGVIRESDSEFASPIVLVAKKDGDYRLCVDYRALNANTIKEMYPMPNIDDQLNILGGKMYFTSLDCYQGFHQICVEDDSVPKTAFITPDGQYEYLKMPFGLVNAPAVFQRAIHKALGPLRHGRICVYMDDILLPSIDIGQGLKLLDTVLGLLNGAGFKLNLEKCSFFKRELSYLGHEVSAAGIRPGSRKIEAICQFKQPKNIHEIRQFLGLSSYFRKFVRNFATIAKPLTELTKKGIVWTWGDKQQLAFEQLKTLLVSQPVLALYDSKLNTEVHTDASALGLGGVLLQLQGDGNFKPVAYYSRTTSSTEKHYHSYELETLAVVESLRRFRPYLFGLRFKIVTDCVAVRHTFTKRDLIPRIARWWLSIQEYDFEIEYRPGNRMRHADALSRNPIPTESVTMIISNDDWFLTLQLQDDRLKSIVAQLENDPPKHIRDNFVVRDQRLYRKTIHGERLVIPAFSKFAILRKYHDEIGHPGLRRCETIIKSSFWFPQMTRFIRKYVESCISCAYRKGNYGRPEGKLHPIDKPGVPMHTVHIDHVGPFAKSRSGHSYLLTLIDSFTKYVVVRPTKTLGSAEAIRHLREIFGTFLGYPKRLISDRGLAFTSRHFNSFLAEHQIRHVMNAVATPRANGQIERSHRTILDAIGTTVAEDDTWDSKIPELVWGINNTINSTTRYSPYELMFGHKGNLLNDLESRKATLPLDEMRGKATANQTLASERMKQSYDKHRKDCKTYNKGDLVLWRDGRAYGQSSINRKITDKYTGPYKVTKLLGNDRYKIRAVKGMRGYKKFTATVAADALRPYKSVVEISGDESDNEVRDVEDLLDLLEG